MQKKIIFTYQFEEDKNSIKKIVGLPTFKEFYQKICQSCKIEQSSIQYKDQGKNIDVETEEQYQDLLKKNNPNLKLLIQRVQQKYQIEVQFNEETQTIKTITEIEQLKDQIKSVWPVLADQEFYLVYQSEGHQDMDIETNNDLIKILTNIQQVQLQVFNYLVVIKENQSKKFKNTTQYDQFNDSVRQGFNIPQNDQFNLYYFDQNEKIIIDDQDQFEIYKYQDKLVPIQIDKIKYIQVKSINNKQIIVQVLKDVGYEQFLQEIKKIYPQLDAQQFELSYSSGEDIIGISSEDEFDIYLLEEIRQDINVTLQDQFEGEINNQVSNTSISQDTNIEQKQQKQNEEEKIQYQPQIGANERQQQIERLNQQKEIERQQQIEIERQNQQREIDRQSQIEIQTRVIIQQQRLQILQKYVDPQCSEHLINNMIYDCNKSNYPKIEDLNLLKKMINDDEQIDSKNIDQLFECLKTSLKNNDQLKSISNLQELLQQTRPLNIEELSQLINRAEEAANQVKDQEIILLMGQTGAGKSTTIYYLAGQKLQIERIDIGSGMTIDNFAPIGQIINKDLENINISCKGVSETRYITPIQIQISKSKTAMICDSPGFGDTAGAEVDIANSIGIIEAIKLCKTVRPVILVSQMMVGDRGDGLKKLTQLIVSMFKGNIKDQLKSFTYLYSKFSNETKINSFLKNIYNSIKKDEDDESFIVIFEDMIDKYEEIDKINPLQDSNRDTILQNIWNKRAIRYPVDVFQYIMTENSRSRLLEQTNLHEKCIQRGLQNFQFDLVNHKMNQLKLLNDKLKLGQLEILYKQKVQQIRKFISEQYNMKIEEFNKIIENQNDLQQDDIQKYRNFLNKIRPAQILRQNHVSDIQSAEELVQNIILQGNKLLKRLEKIDVYDQKLMTNFNNLQLINHILSDQEFRGFKNIYEKALESLNIYFEGLQTKSVTLINQNQYNEVVVILNSIQQFIKIFDKKIDLSEKNQVCTKIIKQINDQIIKLNYQCASIVQKEKFDEQELKILIEQEQRLQNLSETYEIHHYISKESIQQASNEFYNYFLKYFEEIYNEINDTLNKDRGDKSENQGLFLSIKLKFEKMVILRNKITNLEYKSSKIQNNSLSIIASYVNEVRQQSQPLLDQLKKDSQNFDFEQFRNILDKLKNSEWIDGYNSGFYADTIKQLEKFIIKQLQTWQDELDELPLDIKNGQNIQTAYKIKQQSEKFKQFKDQFNGIDIIISSISDRFKQAFEINLNIIKDQFKPIDQENLTNNLDAEIAETAIVYLNYCKKQIKLREEIQQTENILYVYLKNYSNTSLEKIKKSLDGILNAVDEEQMKKISDIVQRVYQRLKNLNSIKELKNILEFIPAKDIIQNIKNILIQIYREFKEILLKNDDILINENKQKTKILSQLDEFIDQPDHKFYPISQEFMARSIQKFKEDQSKLLDAINKSQYQLFSQRLKNITHVDQKFKTIIMEQLSASIIILCDKLRTQINMMKKDFTKQEIQQIADDRQLLKDVKKFIPKDYLDDQTFQKLIQNDNQCMNIIKEKIKQKINQIDQNLCDNLFEQAENIRQQLIQLNEFEQAKDIINDLQIDGLEKKIEDQIEKKCQQQCKFTIKDYRFHSPNQLLEQLEIIYKLKKKYFVQNQINILNQKIQQDIQNEIQLLQNGSNEEKIKKISELKQAIKFIPQKLTEFFAMQIDQEETKINDVIQNLNREFQDLKDSDDPNKHFQFIQNCKKNKNIEFSKKMEDFVDTKVRQIEQNMISSIQNQDYKDGLKQYLIILKYHKIFVESVLIKNVTNKSNNFLQYKFENFITALLKIQQGNQIQANIEKYYENYQQFIFVNDDINVIFPDQKHPFQSSNESKLQQIFIQHFKNICESYENSLKILDIKNLEESLQEIKKWQNLMQNICLSQNKSMPELNIIISKFKKDHNEMSKQVTEQLYKCQQEIQKESFKLRLEERQLEKHYQEFELKCLFIKQAYRIKEFIQSDYNLKTFESDIQPKLNRTISELIQQTLNTIKQEAEDINYEQISINLKNLIVYEKCSKNLETNNGIDLIKNEINQKVKKYIDICYGAQKDFKIIVQNMINIQKIIDEIPSVSKDIKIKMQQLLKRLKSQLTPIEFSQINILLEQDNGPGKSIIQEHEQFFKGFQIQLFRNKTQNHKIDYVMQNIDGESIDKDKLQKFYDRYQQKYQELIKKYIVEKQNDIVIKELTNTVKQIPSKKINQKDKKWDVQNEIIDIMAYIFTIQTFSNIQYYNEMKDVQQEQKEKDQFLWQPHPGQIIAIFRILGIGYKDGFFKTLFSFNESRLVNNLIQIGTGEGKSVTLAVTSCILALYDIDVYCACYSEYLSQRDYSSFSKLFEQLGLIEKIHYGTFNKLCESVINDKFNIRQKVTNTVNQSGASQEEIKNNTRSKILLIDEVDVFFSDKFYGNIYQPVAKIKHSKIKELTDFLWSNREKKLNMKQIEETQEFKELCKQFTGWESLIQEIVKSMKQDLQCFKHDYIVQNQKIGYKEQDQIVFNVVYGYKTMWAHYHEYDEKKILLKFLEDNISIQIKCGTFSFAEIPKSFLNILGVTGTLKNMSQAQKKIISDDYQIKIQTYMPSIFGKNQCEFNEKASVKYWDKDDYFKEIFSEIKNNIGVKPNQRACLVFFETKEKLMEFYKYYTQQELSNIYYITEESLPDEQSANIKKSTNPGSVTLLTKLFGRGIDFVVRDENMNANRGIHVLQTFLSEEVSEEVQIKGRTARQGQKGTYSMVLLEQDLEKYIGPNYLQELKDMQDKNNLYSSLNDKRNLYLDDKQKSISDMIQTIKKDHDDAENFKKSLLEKEEKLIQDFLLSQNRGEPEQTQSRTICLMDATGSMSSLLQKTKNTVGQMFQRASDILKQKNLPEDCFQLQFVVYRDYDCMEGILQYSTWESKPDQLRNFIDKISAQGGGGNDAEAIEIGLFHCNRENQNNRIDQIILIGDEPAKAQLDINRDREQYGGEDYWIKNGFPNTHHLKEIEKLQQHKIPIHSFYVRKYGQVKSNFEEISKLTEGKSGFLQIDNDSGSEQLTNVVCETILSILPKGYELVESYRQKFGKAFA